jgi:hypothetical protein
MPTNGPTYGPIFDALDVARLNTPGSVLFGLTHDQAHRIADFVMNAAAEGRKDGFEEGRTAAKAEDRKLILKGMCAVHGTPKPGSDPACVDCRLLLDIPRARGQRGAMGPAAMAARFKRIRAGEALGPGPGRRWTSSS